jgi:hypothetical protein
MTSMTSTHHEPEYRKPLGPTGPAAPTRKSKSAAARKAKSAAARKAKPDAARRAKSAAARKAKSDAARLKQLERQLRSAHEAVGKSAARLYGVFETTLERKARAGGILTEIKTIVGHKNYGPWLREHFTGADRTARSYCEVYKYYDDLRAYYADANRQGLADLPPLAVALEAVKKVRPKPKRARGTDAESDRPDARHATREPRDADFRKPRDRD